jgi:hypothetical protein
VSDRLDEYARGRAEGERARAAGIGFGGEEAWETLRGRSGAFKVGYRMALNDEVARAPLPVWGVVLFTAAEALPGAWYTRARGSRGARLAPALAVTFALQKAQQEAERWMARRAGLRDVPPWLAPHGAAALNLGAMIGLRRLRKSRAFATQFGITLPRQLVINRDWRKDVARWRERNYQR